MHSLSDFEPSSKPKAAEYILRSLISLNQFGSLYEKTEPFSEELGDESLVVEVVTEYAKYLEGKEHGLEHCISEYPQSEIVVCIGSLYFIREQKTEQALNLLNSAELTLECLPILIQLRVITGRLDLAKRDLETYRKISHDSLVFNVSESWVHCVSAGESLQSPFYLYEEMAQSHPSVKSLLSLFVVNLQLHHFVEVEELLEQLEKLYESSSEDKSNLLANLITLHAIKGEGENVEKCVKELASMNSHHPCLVDYNQKVADFEAVVAKYSDQVVR